MKNKEWKSEEKYEWNIKGKGWIQETKSKKEGKHEWIIMIKMMNEKH